MAVVPEDIKKELKKPLGRIGNAGELPALAKKFKIIAVGDISVIACIDAGVKPFISVFDFRYMRKELDEHRKRVLHEAFPGFSIADNPAGEITASFVKAAESIIKKKGGGAILVRGEEDLTALVFIALAGKNSLIIYGQPNEGLVFVEPGKNSESRKKAKEILKKLGFSF